ncbi:ecdysone-inducible e1 isoform a [Holotrichia oblita]|uniref:Ecdysone-inducible e1 isoform a n=1 Tax=Holotrichia oblita TaxID=644536 RepID=A0ACB9SQ66_HOLOL|nr:ecdysone-inducible e1 isoform a [Holotrichia oblita]
MLSLIFLTSVLFMNGIHTQDVVTDPDFDTDVRIARLMSHHPCRLDRDCLPHSFCIGNDATNTGFCRCEDGWIISRNRTTYECLWRPGEICNVDFNCLLSDGSIGTCHIGRCRCPPRHHHTSDGRCVPTSRLGENCTTDDNCRHTFANCIGVCRCLPGYVISENGWRCLQAATEFTDTCDELAQCSTYLSGSFCQNNTCTCNPGSHPLGPRCWRSAIVGGRCDDRRNCYMHSGADDAVAVDCVDGRCRCNEGFENVRGVCSVPGGATVNKMYFIYVILANVLTIFVWIR